MIKKHNSKSLSSSVKIWEKYYRLNHYYHSHVQKLVAHLTPTDAVVLEFGSRGGELLSRLKNKTKIGIEAEPEMVSHAKKKNREIDFVTDTKFFKKYRHKKFDYIILTDVLSKTEDVQNFLNKLRKFAHSDTRIVVVYFSFLWKLFLDLAEKTNLKYPKSSEPNWLSTGDIDNFFLLEGFEKIKGGRKFIVPYEFPFFSELINKYISPLPIINLFCLTQYTIYRLKPTRKEYSVSIIIPARNEEGNMKRVLNKIPQIGRKTEVVFVEGHSKDGTYQAIAENIKNYKGPIKAKLYKQIGVGKGNAVRLGFAKASNELLMILDADLTVSPSELIKFYEAAASGLGDLIIGSRLVYPMEKQAMRTLNLLGNKFFSQAFSFLLNQRIKDTLCGTKVLLKKNYSKIEKNRNYFGDFDPFGDFDLIFGAAKLNMKIVEIPVRYRERVYGTTNISRFNHGFLLLKMVGFAARKIKFI